MCFSLFGVLCWGHIDSVELHDRSDVMDIACTWRVLPSSLQQAPDDIGELAHKETHNQIVLHVLGLLGGGVSDARVRVVSALAAQSINIQ